MSQICLRTGCSKPVYIETNGLAHPYCGKTCASFEINKSGCIKRCKNPSCSRQNYVDLAGFQYDYCGKTCARQFLNSEAPYCIRSNCPRRAYTDPQDKKKFHSYCSPSCYWLECSTLTKTKLSLLKANDLDFIAAHQRFISMLPQVNIKAIFRLQMPKPLVDAHQNLKNQLAKQHNLPLNLVTHKMFHGTKANCDPLQYLSRLSPLCSNGCGLCGIVTQGNNTAYSRNSGQMWFANHASTSAGYCSGGSVNVIFMVDVLAPSANSILIVGQNAATLPRFLILYR
ncbi:7696_t:CDS:2 [Funneliformis geosporum]|nr:7696_t:CDS:2 [Funneliformis geosporum]